MVVGGIAGLFPLNRLNTRWTGYYMDAQGQVFSTKMSTLPRKMQGSTSVSGKYYTLSNGSGYGQSENAVHLFNRAKQDHTFKKETSLVVEPAPHESEFNKLVGSPMKDRDHALTLAEGIKKRGYIIGKVQGEALVFGSKPAVHTTLKSVKSEIERLAAKTPGLQLVYLKIEGAVRAASLVWE